MIKPKALLFVVFVVALSSSLLARADKNVDTLNTQIEQLKRVNQKLEQREKFSEVVVYRGSPGNEQRQTITVFIPENASNIQVKVYMKNEPWGGAQNPPKPNTDDLGSSVYKECPMGGGDCPIAWSSVTGATTTSLPDGRTQVSATFSNWAHRNDRTGKLLATYQVNQ